MREASHGEIRGQKDSTDQRMECIDRLIQTIQKYHCKSVNN
jgi:hypothetical protein